jgi:putative SOS response-associated peptidase YedK
MCGRKTLTKSKLDIIRELSINQWDDLIDYKPSYNIAPTHQHPIIIQEKEKRIIKQMKWGLIPSWSKDESFASNMINARQETLSEKSSFKDLVYSQRCLIPIDGYYEWKIINGQKQPYYIFTQNKDLFCLLGLWSSWKNPLGNIIESYTVITTNADNQLNHIHHRMPVLQNDDIGDWLNTSLEYQSFNFNNINLEFEYYPVSSLVNSVKNNTERCIVQSNISQQKKLF